MTSQQVKLIRETFALVALKSRIAALAFYQHLFTLDASLRPMFQHDIEQQGDKLMHALRFAVDSLEQPRELQSVLQSLGRRHAHYGVQERHYDTVGLALMDTLGQLLGPVFTAEAREAWLAVYTHIADTMKQAAAEGQGTLRNVRHSGQPKSSDAATSRAPKAE